MNMLGPLNALAAYIAGRVAMKRMEDDAEFIVASAYGYIKALRLPADARVKLFAAIVEGEDRRFFGHRGVDLRAVARAMVSTYLRGRAQGGSTIEQQLVRTVRRRYEVTVARKVSEMCLAAYLSQHVSKSEILLAYLAVAYFGWRRGGISAVLRQEGIDARVLTWEQAAEIAALLRYPRPKMPSSALELKIARRKAHILSLLRQPR